MSVDFSSCDVCGAVICDCGDDWNICPDCGRKVCTKCLAKPFELREDYEMNQECCPFCSGKEVHDDDLLDFLLKRLGLTKEKAIELYKEEVLGEVKILDLTNEKYCGTLDDCKDYMQELLVDREREEAGFACCGDDEVEDIFKYQDKYYKIIIEIDWNRYDKQFYFVDGSRVKSCEEIEMPKEVINDN